MSDYTLPPDLQAKLDEVKAIPINDVMSRNVRPPIAFLMASLLNANLPGDELVVAFSMGLSTVLAISQGQKMDHGARSPLEEEKGVEFTGEDMLQFNFALVRDFYDRMLAQVRSEHMDMKAQRPSPERTM